VRGSRSGREERVENAKLLATFARVGAALPTYADVDVDEFLGHLELVR
jgi:hypothetical protein